jgi:hypothetical protein
MTEPCTIPPDAILDDSAVRHALGIHPDQLARARRRGGLRYSRRGGRNYYLGRWLLDWLTGDSAHAAGHERAEVAQ